MNNPRLQQFLLGMRDGGGGMPDVSSLMSDPNIANLASQFMGGAGGGSGGGDAGTGRGAGRGS